MAEFRAVSLGGAPAWNPDWVYSGYASTTDDFGSHAQDTSNWGMDCYVAGCAMGFACMPETTVSPNLSPCAGPGGICGVCERTCIDSSTCSRALNCSHDTCTPGSCSLGTCVAGLCTVGHCEPNSHWNDWMRNVMTRVTIDAGWLPAIRIGLAAQTGARYNGTRDFDLGSDTWYDKMVAADVLRRYEVTRAVSSVAGRAIPARDDFPTTAGTGLAISPISTSGTHVQWGNGSGAWPNFEDIYDQDTVVFRGIYGVNYQIYAVPFAGTAVDMAVDVVPLVPYAQPLYAPDTLNGPSALVQTGALPADGWYQIFFRERFPATGRWHAYVSAPADDFWPGPTIAPGAFPPREAYPATNGATIRGRLNFGYDQDYFKIVRPLTTGVPMTFTATPLSGALPYVDVYRPDGTLACSAPGTCSVASTVSHPVGWWLWRVRDASGFSVRDYDTTATFTCPTPPPGGLSCEDPSDDPPIVIGPNGDRLAGRLEPSWHVRYSLNLNANQHASISLADVQTTGTCRYQVDLYGPSAMRMFQGAPIFRWRDGSAANDPAGNYYPNLAGGGHVIAPVAGEYIADVSLTYGTNCWYRIFASTHPGFTSTARPAW